MPGILVGVDGSHDSRHALRWAMREAATHHVPLTVMAVRPALIRPATEIFWNVPELPEVWNPIPGSASLPKCGVYPWVAL